MLLIGAYVIFACVTSFFVCDINPLARGPRAQYTGRIELLFAATKIAATFLGYLVPYISNVVAAIILCILSSTVFYKHCKLLPFYVHRTNLLRGGIYAALTWTTFSTVVVAIVKAALGGAQSQAAQTAEWASVALIPVAFGVGVVVVHKRRKHILKRIAAIRSQWQWASSLVDHDVSTLAVEVSTGAVDGDLTSLRKRPLESLDVRPYLAVGEAGNTSGDAWLLARMLIADKEDSDPFFLQYLVCRASQENPTSEALKIFKLGVMRFVWKNFEEFDALIKRLTLDLRSLPLDHRCVCVCVGVCVCGCVCVCVCLCVFELDPKH